MAESLAIANLLAVSTLAANGRPQLSVGIEQADGLRFWANCLDVESVSGTAETAVFDPVQAIGHVTEIVRPRWQNQPLTKFRPLARLLNDVVEPFTYSPTISPDVQPTPGTLSRRSLITGFLADDDKLTEPGTQQITIERPLHPALQYGLTAALLPAVAWANRTSVAELVAREYGLALGESAVSLLIPLDDESIQVAQSILQTHVAALGYTTSNTNHKATLGAGGERLQQHIRQVAAWLKALGDNFLPALNIDLKGGFGALFDNNPGKVLGALYGLEQAAKPYHLHIQNPVWLESRKTQIEQLAQLKSYVQLRQMKLQLVADAWADSRQNVALFAKPNICHMVHVELPRLGNLDDGITAVLHCQSQNLPVVLSGESQPLTTHIALATRPSLLRGLPGLHYNVMQQFFAAS